MHGVWGHKWPKKVNQWGCAKIFENSNKYTHSSTNISEVDQNMLWDLEHNPTDHIPGKLSLCIGMPIMIRYNIATELCITKGQEGDVAGWESKPGLYGKEILDMLFVKLTIHQNQ